MDSRRDFTSKKVFSGYFSELGEKANSALLMPTDRPHHELCGWCHDSKEHGAFEWSMKRSSLLNVDK